MSLTTCNPRRLGDVARRLALGAGIAVAALVGLPSIASAASTCVLNANTLIPTLEVVDGSGVGAPVRIVRSGQSIAIADGAGTPRVCGGATVFNTARVNITTRENTSGDPLNGFVIIDSSQGAFAPGHGEENDGIRELEVTVNASSDRMKLRIVGTPGADQFRIGAGNKIMIGPDADNDISWRTPGIFPGSTIEVDGERGNDYISGRGGYPLSSPLPYTHGLRLIGGDGNDTLVDTTSGFADFLDGRAGDDFLYSVDGAADLALAGEGFDRATIDAADTTDAEQRSVANVGVLRLSPGVVRAKAGKVAKLNVSWAHPEAWRKLRNVEVRLFRGDNTGVGAFRITAKPERITTQGSVRLLRGSSGVTHRDKAVVATLAVRVPKRLAGERMRVDVEATDLDGSRQREPGAGLITIK